MQVLADPGVSSGALSVVKAMVYASSVGAYVRGIWGDPYDWQADLLADPHKRIAVNGARQSGKSTIVAAFPAHTARFFPKSLSLVLAATERQAKLDMRIIKDYIALDPDYPEIVRMGQDEIELDNRSIISVVPATEVSARGHSKPRMVLVDEGSRVEDVVYTSGVMPYFTSNPEGKLIILSTPNGPTGLFARVMKLKSWSRYWVRAPYLVDDQSITIKPSRCEKILEEIRAQGIRAYLSPRHRDLQEQLNNLELMGALMYRQEYLAEFVEHQDQVFRSNLLDIAFSKTDVKPLFKEDQIGTAVTPALEVI